MNLGAIGIQADFVQVIHKLWLANVRLDLPEESIQAFEKLLTVVPKDFLVIFQIPHLYDQQNKLKLATKWFNVLATHTPIDPVILPRLGQIFRKKYEYSQGFHYQLERFQKYSIDIDVICWLGDWFVNNDIYKNSIQFLIMQ